MARAAPSQTTPESLRTHVYQELRAALRRGKLGAKGMATERDLADQLGVSRTPVREALVLLAHEGLVSPTTRGFSTPKLSPQDIAELYEVRRMLEPNALASTIDHLSAHDIRMLQQALSAHEKADAAKDVAAFAAANSRFRTVWLAAIPNARLRRLIETHDDHVRWLREATLHEPKVRRKVIAGLRAILAALQGGKPAAAAAAMMAHLEAAESALQEALGR